MLKRLQMRNFRGFNALTSDQRSLGLVRWGPCYRSQRNAVPPIRPSASATGLVPRSRVRTQAPLPAWTVP